MRIAITGGIGAGKTHVCRCLERRGIAVYDCDAAAKRLMRESEQLKTALRRLVGNEVYSLQGELNKPLLAQFLLANAEHQQAVNDIVHPAVARDFDASGMQWIESAIFFDSGFYRRVQVDRVVCVTAPLEVRLRRIMQRDGITREQAMHWVNRQLPQEEVARRADFVIVNDGQTALAPQLDRLLTPSPIP